VNITSLSDFDSADPESLQEFFDLNDIAHGSVHDAMLESGTLRDRYPLYTEEPDENWLFVHDRDHRTRAAALNLPTPPDLAQVDFSDPAQVAAWKQYHYDHHILLNKALGL
jgi:hypothetical protein